MARGDKQQRPANKTGYRLVVPIDATAVDEAGKGDRVRVVFAAADGTTTATEVSLDAARRGTAELALDRPAAGRVLVGPADAEDQDLQQVQALSTEVSARAWRATDRVEVAPVVIAPYHWRWWRRWCRTFTVTGRVVCPDGNPVPGATVCAYDVDQWWWWCSEQQVGCATTDTNGAFTITFRWCCGWWPIWWFKRRTWTVDATVAERLSHALRDAPGIDLPRPSPTPDVSLFERLVARDGEATGPARLDFEPERIESLRRTLVTKLPQVAELGYLWPWRPWAPWWDCTPDLTFRVTQDCGQGEVVILDETCADARWNVPQQLDVTLVATDEACCVRPRPECGEEGCIVLSHVCGWLVDAIGGNLGTAGPDGYLHPGAVATYGDRPFADAITIRGACVDWLDYYEFEYSANGGATWNTMPPNAAGGFTLTYWDPVAVAFGHVSFPFANVGGRWVVETVGHWEAANGPRIWVGDTSYLMVWRTTTPSSPTGPTALFADGTYHLRLRGWQEAGGTLVEPAYPPVCGTDEENRLVVTLDNRMVGPGAGHVNSPGHQCGDVHACTTEPDTDIVSLRIGGTLVEPCDIVNGDEHVPVEIELLADDPDGHLAYYTLTAYYGENQSINLLAVPGRSLVPITAAQAGPTYGLARTGGTAENPVAAVAPTWAGGRMRLTLPDVSQAFPVQCAYLLDLRAYKRTVSNCDANYVFGNRSTYAFTVEKS